MFPCIRVFVRTEKSILDYNVKLTKNQIYIYHSPVDFLSLTKNQSESGKYKHILVELTRIRSQFLCGYMWDLYGLYSYTTL